MKSLVINNTIILFLSIDDMVNLKRNDLKKIKNNHLNTYDNCIIYNYFDLKNHKDLIRDKINKLKFINQKKIHARTCNIKTIENDDKNRFLNVNHIQGTDKSQIFYGAYYKNELIALMTFDNKKGVHGGVESNTYDLSRFAIKKGHIITGIFNKILKVFINDYKPSKIISYADLNFVNKNRNIYESGGFKLNKTIQPDFKYYHPEKNALFHKFTFGTKYVKNPNISNEEKKKTEKIISPVWNCGKLKYELFLNENQDIVFGFIYKIENKVNGKIYIGQTTRNLNKRIYEYKSAYNLNKFNNEYLLNAFKKYGWDNFEFKIVDSAQTIEELNTKEIKYIQQYKSNDKKIGYNIHNGGRNSIPHTETLERMSKSHSGIKQTENWINKRIAKAGTGEAKKYGKKKTDEEKLYLSKNSPKYWLGKERDEKTKKKISETKKKNGISKNQKEVLCKKVYKINLNTNKIFEFESTKKASEIEGVNQSTISRWCKNQKTKNNFLWKYV